MRGGELYRPRIDEYRSPRSSAHSGNPGFGVRVFPAPERRPRGPGVGESDYGVKRPRTSSPTRIAAG